ALTTHPTFSSPTRHPPRSTLFPYTTLFRSARRRERAPRIHVVARHRQRKHPAVHPRTQRRPIAPVPFGNVIGRAAARRRESTPRDRKSTRLNSSHVAISYAVFCLKKKKPHH